MNIRDQVESFRARVRPTLPQYHLLYITMRREKITRAIHTLNFWEKRIEARRGLRREISYLLRS